MSVESALQIRLVRENLALAIALWGAANRGVISAGFVPNQSEFVTADQRVVKVSAPLDVRDTQDLVRCTNNQVRGAFAFSAIQANRALEEEYGNSPINAPESDLQAARCALYLISKTAQQDLMNPVWVCPPDYRQVFEISAAGFSLDASDLDGKKVYWSDFGGLNRYIDLLEYCDAEVTALAPPIAADVSEQPAAEIVNPTRIKPVVDVTLSDLLGGFVEARCSVSPGEKIIAKDLYDAYRICCQERGSEPLTQRSFGMRLTAAGFQRQRRGRGKHWWLGIGLTKLEVSTR